MSIKVYENGYLGSSKRRTFPRIPVNLHEVALFVRESDLSFFEEASFFTIFLQPEVLLGSTPGKSHATRERLTSHCPFLVQA